MKVKSESEVTQLCPTVSDPVDCSLPGSSVHGIFQARVLAWGAIAFSERFSAIPIKIQAGFFAEIDKLILKFPWKSKGPRIAKTIFKKNKIGGLTFPSFKTYKSCSNEDRN